MYWAILGIFHSMFRAIVAETGKDSTCDPWHLALWQALCGVAVFAFTMPFAVWPDNLDFLFAAIFTGLIIAVGSIIQLNLNMARIGRVSAVSMPLEAFLGFALWLIIWPASRDAYLGNPGSAFVTLLIFALASGALFYIRRNDVGAHTFLIAAPVGFSFAVAGVVMKLAIPAEQAIQATISFVLVSQLVMAVVIGAVLMLKGQMNKGFTDQETTRTGLTTGVFATMAYFTFVLGVVFAPNPGLVSFLAVLVPVWLMWYHEMRWQGDRSSPAAALIIAISVITLIGMTVL